MSDNGECCAFGRGPTFTAESGGHKLVCRRRDAPAYNAWTPTLNGWLDVLRHDLDRAKEIDALPEEEQRLAFRFAEYPQELVETASRLLDATVIEVDGEVLNGTPASHRLYPDEVGPMLVDVWNASRVTDAERGKSEPPSQS